MKLIKYAFLALAATALIGCETMTPRNNSSTPMEQGGASPGERTDPSPTNITR